MVWMQRIARPYLVMGWLWFLGTLVPVIGVVQVGDQAMADRYAYLPLIGIFVALVWTAFDWVDLHHVDNVRWAVPAVVLLAICFLTFQQLEYWRDSETIWTRALQITHGDLLVEKQLANALVMLGETDKALPHLIHIAQVDPKDTTTHANLGACYAAQDRIEDATDEFQKVIQLTNHKELSLDDRKFRTSAFLNLGFAYSRSKDYPNALVNFQEASQFDASMVDQMISDFERDVSTQPTESLYLKLSLLLQARGKDNEATSVLEQQIKLYPDSADSRALLNYLRMQPKLKALAGPAEAQVATSQWAL
jgi:tetratricopeptide (TPR) repeat protein